MVVPVIMRTAELNAGIPELNAAIPLHTTDIADCSTDGASRGYPKEGLGDVKKSAKRMEKYVFPPAHSVLELQSS